MVCKLCNCREKRALRYGDNYAQITAAARLLAGKRTPVALRASSRSLPRQKAHIITTNKGGIKQWNKRQQTGQDN
jgi:hypothetical protein